MAKLIDVEEKNIRRKNLVKTVVLIIALLAVIAASFVHFEAEKAERENRPLPTVGVHVKGAVNESGFYVVPYGTRIGELGEFTEGFMPNADLDGVNLAGYVYDGQEVYFPFKGSKEEGAINLNTATSDELQSVSGIGETSAETIISYREEHGGFTSVIELKEILGAAKYEAVREKFYIE